MLASLGKDITLHITMERTTTKLPEPDTTRLPLQIIEENNIPVGDNTTQVWTPWQETQNRSHTDILIHTEDKSKSYQYTD